MRSLSRCTLFLLLLLVAACSRDPGLDVKPMPDPLSQTAGVAERPTEIIPLDQVSKSQPAAVSQRIANTEVTITYSRPVARGRDIFGALVPYDAVWTPGADRATAVALTRDVQINGRALAAGKYSLWAIPRASAWTLILNRSASVFHGSYPGAEQDALRFDVPPEASAPTEVLTFDFPAVEGKDATLRLRWGRVAVPMSIRVP